MPKAEGLSTHLSYEENWSVWSEWLGGLKHVIRADREELGQVNPSIPGIYHTSCALRLTDLELTG